MRDIPDTSHAEVTQPVQPVELPLQPKRAKRRRTNRPRWYRQLKKRLSFRIKPLNVFLIILSIAVVITVAGLALYSDTTNRVDSALASVNRVLASISDRSADTLTLEDFTRLQASVNELHGVLNVARSRANLLAPFGFLNDDLKASALTLTAALDMTEAVSSMLAGLEPAASFLFSGGSSGALAAQGSSGERLVELLRLGQGQFLDAQSNIAAAHEQLEQLDFASVSPGTILTIEDIRGYLDQISELNTTLVNAPDLVNTVLGLDADTDYLVLSQNSDELRPSGGYLSTYGYVVVRNGRVVDYDYTATTTTSPNPPPQDAPDIPEIPEWWIQYNEPIYAAWDGSWYTDFPSTAEMAMWYYDAGRNPRSPVDGVIAIDIIGFEYLLEVLGSVTVPGYDITVTPENFRDVVYDIRAYGEGSEPHKRFIAEMYQEIFAQWQAETSDPQTNAQLFSALLRALQEKHIMLHFGDERLNDAIDALGWSGEQQSAIENDYLQVADANLGNKSNHSIERSLTYDVTIHDDGSLDSRLNIDYDYSALVAEEDPAVNPEFHGPLDYNNLLQVFVPLGSSVMSYEGLGRTPITVNTDINTIFVAAMNLPYDTSARVQYVYTSPPIVEEFGAYQRYQLLIQKQPGRTNEQVTVTVALPEGARLISVSPDPTAVFTLDTQVLEFRLNLLTDQWIEIVYQ
jgi:hypothetical protein